MAAQQHELTMPPAILPTACYTVEQVATALGVGARTVERWPLAWFFLGTRTRRVMGQDLLDYLNALERVA